MNKKYLLVSLIFVLWLALAVRSYNGTFLSKALIDEITPGYSSFKLYFFLMWAGGLFFLLSFNWTCRRRFSPLPLIVAILAIMATSILSYLYFITKYRLGTDYTLAYVDNFLSSDALYHIHTLKAGMVFVIQLFGLQKVYRIADPGVPYFYLLPHAFHVAGDLLLLVIMVLMAWGAVYKEKQWSPFWRVPLLCNYVISSFAILKNSLDGGPISFPFFFYFLVFCLCLKIKQESMRDVLMTFAKYLVPCLGILVVVYAFFFRPMLLNLLNDTLGGLLEFLLINTIVFLCRPSTRNKWTWGLFILTAALFFPVFSQHYWSSEYRNLARSLPPGSDIYVFNWSYTRLPGNIVYKEGKVGIYDYHVAQQTSVWNLYRHYHIVPSYREVMVVNQDCSPTGTFAVSGKIRNIGPAQLNFHKKSEMFTTFSINPCSDTQQCDYNYIGLIKDCVPNPGQLIVLNHLSEMGFKRVILTPDRLGGNLR